METRTRYFQGVDHKGSSLFAAIQVKVGSSAERAEPEEIGKLFGMTGTREITASAHSKGTKQLDEKPRGRAKG